ncbi:hypothetical protein OUZ56_032600, partial [Daphnia magna]
KSTSAPRFRPPFVASDSSATGSSPPKRPDAWRPGSVRRSRFGSTPATPMVSSAPAARSVRRSGKPSKRSKRTHKSRHRARFLACGRSAAEGALDEFRAECRERNAGDGGRLREQASAGKAGERIDLKEHDRRRILAIADEKVGAREVATTERFVGQNGDFLEASNDRRRIRGRTMVQAPPRLVAGLIAVECIGWRFDERRRERDRLIIDVEDAAGRLFAAHELLDNNGRAQGKGPRERRPKCGGVGPEETLDAERRPAFGRLHNDVAAEGCKNGGRVDGGAPLRAKFDAARARQPGEGEELAGGRLVHRVRARTDRGADVGDAVDLKEPLQGTVFADSAVGHREDHRRIFAPNCVGERGIEFDANDGKARLRQCGIDRSGRRPTHRRFARRPPLHNQHFLRDAHSRFANVIVRRRATQIHEFNTGCLGKLVNLRISVELAEYDSNDSPIDDQSKAAPAWAGRDVDAGTVDTHAVLSRLANRVCLCVDGAHAVPLIHQMTDVIAVRQPADRPVVAGRQNRAVADDDRPDMFSIAGRSRCDFARDVHESLPDAAGKPPNTRDTGGAPANPRTIRAMLRFSSRIPALVLVFGAGLAALPALETTAFAGKKVQEAPLTIEVETAEQLYVKLEYEKANSIAGKVIERGNLTHDQLVRVFRIHAITYAILGNEEEATDAFTLLLGYAPDFQLDADTSPKVVGPFQEAKGYWKAQPSRPGLDVEAQ